MKVKLDHPRSKYNRLRVQCNSDEVEEWLVNGIKEMISRGKTNKEISRIFNRKEEEIQKLIVIIKEVNNADSRINRREQQCNGIQRSKTLQVERQSNIY